MQREIADELRRMAKHAGKEKEVEDFIAGVDGINREISGNSLVTREATEEVKVEIVVETVAEVIPETVVTEEKREVPVIAEVLETVIEERASVATQVSSTGEAVGANAPSNDMPAEGGSGENEVEITADMLDTIVTAVANMVIESLGKDIASINDRLVKVESAITMQTELQRQLRMIDTQMAETVQRLNSVELKGEEENDASYDDMPIAHTSRIAARLRPRIIRGSETGKVKQSFEDIANLTLRNAKGE